MELENTTHQGITLNRKIVQFLTVVGTVATLILGIWIYRTGFFEAEGSFKALLDGMGIYAPLTFLLIQIIQVVYPIIPGGVTVVVAPLVFGPLWGFIYSFIGVLIGSSINFILARKYGKTFVRAFVSEETYRKYYGWLTKGKRFEWLMASAFALQSSRSVFPPSSHFTTTISRPACAADAGLVPCADAGIKTVFR